jgi:hypothetical protein
VSRQHHLHRRIELERNAQVAREVIQGAQGEHAERDIMAREQPGDTAESSVAATYHDGPGARSDCVLYGPAERFHVRRGRDFGRSAGRLAQSAYAGRDPRATCP